MEKALKTIDNAIEILNQTRSMFFADHTVYGGFKKSDFNKAINGLTIISAEIEEAMKPKTCEWKYENNIDMWVGACGAEMVFYNNLTPTQEKMHFCYKCGKNIIEIEPKDN